MPKTNKQVNLAEENVYSKTYYIFLIIGSCCLVSLFLFMDVRKILTSIPDDAAYYFKIAENFVMGKGLTFDGINKTNGFQPLWLIFLINIYYFFQGTPEVMVRLFLIVQVIMLIISSLLMNSIYSDFFSKKTSLIGSIVFLLLVLLKTTNGMESSLLILTMTVLFYFGHKRKVFTQHKLSSEFLFGLILGLVMLSRLDTVFLAISIYIFCFIKLLIEVNKKRDNIIRLLVILAGSTIIVAPYLLYNYLYFDSVMPISGILKSNFPHLIGFRESISHIDKRYIILALLSILYLFYFTFKVDLKKSQLNYFRISILILAVGNILHFLHTMLFMKWAVFNWHFITYWFFLSLVLMEPLDYFISNNFFNRYKKLYWVFTLILVMLFLIQNVKRFGPNLNGFAVATYDAALWARNNTKNTDIFAMKDAGNFGYFSQRSVVNLDGLVNNMEYQEVLKNQNIGEYLLKKGVGYLAQHAFYATKINNGNYKCFLMEYKSFKFTNAPNNKILVNHEDEIYRSPSYFDGSNKTVFIIWKLHNYNKVRTMSTCITSDRY